MDDHSTLHPAKRRAVSLQGMASKQHIFPTDASPSPMTSKLSLATDDLDSPRPVSRRQYVSVDWQERPESRTSSIQIDLEECVETKTVTTTTTTKRSYPPLQIQRPSLSRLDAKEYPLASRELPLELQKFSYALDDDSIRAGKQKSVRRVVRDPFIFRLCLSY
jgi:F-box and WD-40 domain protein CDC4